MKRQDIRVGVKYKRRGEYMSDEIVVLDLEPNWTERPHWNARSTQSRFYQADYGTDFPCAVREIGFRTLDPEGNPIVSWRPAVFKAQQIECTWDEHLAKKEAHRVQFKLDEARSHARRETQALRMANVKGALVLGYVYTGSHDDEVRVSLSDLEHLADFIGESGTDALRERKGLV